MRYVDVAQLQGTLDEDMRRRDFTIDALAVPLAGGEVIDVCGGLGDLAARRRAHERRARVRRGSAAAAAGRAASRPNCGSRSSGATASGDSGASGARDTKPRPSAGATNWRGSSRLTMRTAGVQDARRLGLLDVLLPELAARARA